MSYIPELKQLLKIVHYDPKNPDSKIELGARIVIEGLLKRVAAAYNIEVFCVGVGEHRTLKPGFYWWSCSPGCLPDSEGPYGPYESRYDCFDAATEGLLDHHITPEIGDCVTHTPTRKTGTVRLTRPGYSFVDFGDVGMPFTWVVNGELELFKTFDTGEPQGRGYVNQD